MILGPIGVSEEDQYQVTMYRAIGTPAAMLRCCKTSSAKKDPLLFEPWNIL